MINKSKAAMGRTRIALEIESLERRDVPAILASQTTLVPPPPPAPLPAPLANANIPTLVSSQQTLIAPAPVVPGPPTNSPFPVKISSQLTLLPPVLDIGQGGTFPEVQTLLNRAAVATASQDAIIAIVDRGGNILGVAVESGVSGAITGDSDLLAFAIDGALAKARTAAFFANDTAPLTSRTVQFISQTTITQREVESNPNINDPDSTVRGPGFVAPIGLGGHFPPGVAFAPQVDLFAIEHTNRDSLLSPGPDALKGTPDDISLTARFNINPAFVPAGKNLDVPFAYGEAILTPAMQQNPAVNHFQSRGIATLPGGIPLYQYGALVGGIGVFFPGTTGYATEENSSLGVNFDPNRPDRTLEAEFIALAAAGGSAAADLPVGTLAGIPLPPGFDIPFPRIDLVGITLNTIGVGGDRGPQDLVDFANANFGVGLGAPLQFANFRRVDSTGVFFKVGKTVPDGWLVTPHAGSGISAAQVEQIIKQGIAEANLTRAQIRTPADQRTRMVFAVTDLTGDVLGLYRMPDSTVFSIDVAVAKARNLAYYNDPAQLQEADRVPELSPGVAFTARTFRYLAVPRYPISVEGEPPGPFSNLNAPGIDAATGLNTGAPLPASAYNFTVLGFDSFNPGTNFHATTSRAYQNGVVFFPGSSGVYLSGQIKGGFGVSGDGVDQDDVVTAGGIRGFEPPFHLRADQFFVRGVRLPYLKFPRNPQRV